MNAIRSTAASAAHTAAETIEPSGGGGNSNKNDNVIADAQGTLCEKGSFKDQLNRAAYEKIEEEKKVSSTTEKVMSYIPGASSLTQSRSSFGSASDSNLDAKGNIRSEAMPKRPENDLQVEEFLKEQYRSKSGVDVFKSG